MGSSLFSQEAYVITEEQIQEIELKVDTLQMNAEQALDLSLEYLSTVMEQRDTAISYSKILEDEIVRSQKKSKLEKTLLIGGLTISASVSVTLGIILWSRLSDTD
jgi:hypothetical protein